MAVKTGCFAFLSQESFPVIPAPAGIQCRARHAPPDRNLETTAPRGPSSSIHSSTSPLQNQRPHASTAVWRSTGVAVGYGPLRTTTANGWIPASAGRTRSFQRRLSPIRRDSIQTLIPVFARNFRNNGPWQGPPHFHSLTKSDNL